MPAARADMAVTHGATSARAHPAAMSANANPPSPCILLFMMFCETIGKIRIDEESDSSRFLFPSSGCRLSPISHADASITPMFYNMQTSMDGLNGVVHSSRRLSLSFQIPMS